MSGLTAWGGEEWTEGELVDLMDPRLAHLTPAGLVPVAVPVPPDILEDAMRKFLAKVVSKRRARPGWRYSCMEQLVLEQGVVQRGNFGIMTTRAMQPSACFDNAYLTSLGTEGVRYTEGYAIMDGSAEPFHHAWLTTDDGRVEDPTWPAIWRRKVIEQTMRRWSGDVVYIGISIEKPVHTLWTNRQGGFPNLLSVYDDDIDVVMRKGPAAWL